MWPRLPVFENSTHVKANASRASAYLVEMPEEPGAYWERLDAYEEEGLDEWERWTGKRRKKRTKQINRDSRHSHKRVSRSIRKPGPRASVSQWFIARKGPLEDTCCHG